MFVIEEEHCGLCCKWFKRSLRLVALFILILAWLGLMFADELVSWNQQTIDVIPKVKASAEEANQESVFTSANFPSYPAAPRSSNHRQSRQPLLRKSGR